MHVIDLEVVDTWPPELLALATELSDLQLDDLLVDDDIGERVRDSISGHAVRAFHCTRLLAPEIEHVYAHGLHLLSPELAEKRLETAAMAGALSQGEAQTLREAYTKAVGGLAVREGLIGFCLTTSTLRERPPYFWRLLSFWGGEALYWAVEEGPLGEKLRTIGFPTIVVTRLNPRDFDSWGDMASIAAACVGVTRGDGDLNASVTLSVPVPSTAIEDVIRPPDPRFAELVPWMGHGQ